MNKLFSLLENQLKEKEDKHLLREQHVFETGQNPVAIIDGKQYVLFSSSNYLSMGSNEQLFIQAAEQAKSFGLGSGGSRLTTGTSLLHVLCEEKLAEFVGTEAATLFSSGYMANIGVLSSICDSTWEIYSDEKNHASLIDGCRLSRGKIMVYKHLDYSDLERKLAQSSCEKKLIVTDGVFSMDGDVADVEKLVDLARRYNALSMVDDAHGFGVMGEGHGLCYGMDTYPDIYVGTLSKAVCCEGAFVAGSSLLKTYLFNNARSYIFSTSLSPFTLCSILQVIEEMQNNPRPLARLEQNVEYFHRRLLEEQIPTKGNTHIVPILIGDEQKTMEIAQQLRDRGYYVSGIRYPSVPKKEAILRITLMAQHDREEMDGLIEELAQLMK